MEKFLVVQNGDFIIPTKFIIDICKYVYLERINLGVIIQKKNTSNSYFTLHPEKC